MADIDKKVNLEKLLAKIDEVSTLPQVLKKILDVTADENAGASDLQDILKADPAITSKLLKVANSAYYGLQQNVVNIKNAIIFLGFKTVKNLAVAASVCDMFKSQDTVGGYSREDLWKHSVVVAICAKTIAQRAGLKSGEDVFTAGIMHDIGIIMEDQYLHDRFLTLLERTDLNEVGFTKAEMEAFGFDHALFGESITIQWKIPSEITKLIAFHHKPRQAPEDYQQSATIIYLADVLCNAKKIGFVPNQKVDKNELNIALESLNFKKEDVSLILAELPAEIDKARELFIM